MPKKCHGDVPNTPQTKREHKATKADGTVMKAVEGTGRLDAAVKGGGRK